MKFIHCADLHLGSPLRGLARAEDAPVDEIRAAPERALDNLVDYALAEAVAFVVIAGDLYDGDWSDYRIGLRFARAMSRLREADVAVYLLYGNHDADSRLTRGVPLPENVHVFGNTRPRTFVNDDLGVALHGQSFKTATTTDNLALAYPPPRRGLFNIGVLHTALDGRDGHAPYAPCSARQLAGHGYDYWALGHVHRRDVVHTDPHIVFPGTLQGRHVNEGGDKGFTVVTVDGDRRSVTALEHVAADVARWATVAVPAGAAATIEDVARRFGAEVERSLGAADGRLLCCRVVVEGRSRAHPALVQRPDALAAALRAVALDVGRDRVWLEQVAVCTSPWQDLAALRIRPDALGALLRDIDALPAGDDDREALRRELARLRPLLTDSVIDGPVLEAVRDEALDPILEAARRYLEAALLDLECGE
ncbi:DNA repair exonuclease [Candidatus Binatia bacterium]|nr:DNA repair exonuclease [Candidatus Binatia bacterium]